MKRTKKLFGVFMILSFSAFIIQSCLKDNFDFKKITTSNLEWNANLAVPIVYTQITLRDLLLDYDTTEVLIEDETDFLYIMYEGEVASIEAGDWIKFPTQNYGGVIPSYALYDGGTFFSATLDTITDFSVNNFERLDSIILKYSNLNIAVTSTYKHYGQVFITFPSLTLNGIPLKRTIPISSADGSFSTIASSELNDTIDGRYVFDLTNGGTDDNKLPITIELQLQNSGSPISDGEFVSIDIEFANIKFRAVHGYLGQKSISINTDTVQLEMYNNVFEGEAYFEDPKVRVFIDNSYGIPIEFNLTNLGAYSNIYNVDYPIDMPAEYNPLLINAPALADIGTYAETDMYIDKENSNIKDAMSYLPKYIFYGVDAQLNPDPLINNNFVLDTSRFDVNLEVELPLWGRAKYFAIQDTGKFDMSDYFDATDYIDWILFRLNVDNGFPMDMGLQAYFVDSLYSKLDSLFLDEEQLIQSGVLNDAGRVIEKTYRTTDIIFSHERITNLKDCKYVMFKGTISTTDDATTNVRFYSDYNIDLKFSMQAQLGIPLDTLFSSSDSSSTN